MSIFHKDFKPESYPGEEKMVLRAATILLNRWIETYPLIKSLNVETLNQAGDTGSNEKSGGCYGLRLWYETPEELN